VSLPSRISFRFLRSRQRPSTEEAIWVEEHQQGLEALADRYNRNVGEFERAVAKALGDLKGMKAGFQSGKIDQAERLQRPLRTDYSEAVSSLSGCVQVAREALDFLGDTSVIPNDSWAELTLQLDRLAEDIERRVTSTEGKARNLADDLKRACDTKKWEQAPRVLSQIESHLERIEGDVREIGVPLHALVVQVG